jgi:F-type H+-transporting ATPase subunit epsilon
MAAGNDFQVAIVTPEAQVLDTRAVEVQFPAYDGLIGVLNNRAPLLTKLGTGVITLKATDGVKKFLISGGYAQMKDNVLSILTNEAIPEGKFGPQQITELMAKAQPAQNRTLDAVADREKQAAKETAQA